ncbi:hypothetical protein QYS49_32320 [Marivirga salinae]|uniref:Uncharacterized protein n=1 Tax=Marivirga salinarum TaxID=3059078 RepID=A0AA51NB73_9BACT|nr:hypothetical protein [Marivirga sp. BDSF4-3]WMN12079.1 hypothetical protein QYS49_32320 [Marivirga sp. BDSF4-3]
MNRIGLLIVGLIYLTIYQGYSQNNNSLKSEPKFNIIQIEPDTNWRGYKRNKEVSLDFLNQLFLDKRAGYGNFKLMNTCLALSEFQSIFSKCGLTCFKDLKVGHINIWDQCAKCTGTELEEICIALNLRLIEKIEFYTKIRFRLTKQSLLMPIRLIAKF